MPWPGPFARDGNRRHGVRGLYEPVPIALRWRSSPRAVSAPAFSITAGDVGGRPSRLRLAGDLTTVLDAFRALPKHRLIVLGDAGSGKTALAILLLLQKLDERVPGEAVWY